MLDVVAIIPTAGKKNLPLLKKCVLALVRAAQKKVRLRIIVNTELPIKKFPGFGQHINDVQTAIYRSGYTLRHNNAIELGLKKYTPDYLLLMNDDAWVEKDFFTEFVKMKDKGDVLAPKIVSAEKDVLDSFGVEYLKSGYSKNTTDLSTSTQLASASCTVIAAPLLRRVKKKFGFYFNEVLGWYMEDIELFLRSRSIGARIVKNEKMMAHHVGSFTWGKKSFFTIFQTYRNLIWVIVMTWPAKVLLRNLPNILLVQGALFLYSLIHYGPQLYLKIIWQTLVHFRKLMALRGEILRVYPASFDFRTNLSPIAFRTYHGRVVKGV